MPSDLGGRRALVTGGASGIGRAVALAYQAAGATVTVLDRVPTTEFTSVAGDTTDPSDVAAAVEVAAGPAGALDLLTTCAGVFDHYARVTELEPDDLRRSFGEIFSINVLGTLLAVRAGAPALRVARGAVTITLSTSAYARSGGGVVYASSKAALGGAVRHLADELAPDVRVNGVAPGGTSGTGLTGDVPGRDERLRAATLLGVLPVPSDHVAAYLYLAASRIVTGTVVISDAC
jgi:NAD(P)-dependent dehydrogenase (short-subunit alcohol dehydrogenase family)